MFSYVVLYTCIYEYEEFVVNTKVHIFVCPLKIMYSSTAKKLTPSFPMAAQLSPSFPMAAQLAVGVVVEELTVAEVSCVTKSSIGLGVEFAQVPEAKLYEVQVGLQETGKA